MVAQLVRDYEKDEEINKQLDKMYYLPSYHLVPLNDHSPGDTILAFG